MSSNSDQIVQQIQHDFKELIEYVTGKESQSHTAYQVELTLFRRLLALGRQLLYLFLVQRAAVRPKEPTAPDGTRLTYQNKNPTTYFSVFGKVRFRRHYFHAPGQKGICPLDAELSLPPRCYSDLLRDWAEYGTTSESYDESIRLLERILDLCLSKQALETAVAEDAVEVEAFYEQKAPPPPESEGSILVIQADGKGVPMVRNKPAQPSPRLGKGQKRTKKKEAIVTAIYTIAPYWRTAQQVVDALMRDAEGEEKAPLPAATLPQRPAPVGKEVRATLAGKDVALDRLSRRVAQREGEHIQQRAALTDGAEALQKRVCAKFPGFELVLDIMHALGYLWDVANALLGETHPERTSWVGEQLLQILSGQTSAVIARLEKMVQDPATTAAQAKALNTTIGYYRRNLPYMHYDQYLARGWPISSGVVEGACGHLVKDRMEQSGMRWTKQGAQAILDMRAVRVNDDWDEYHQFRRQCQHQRLYSAHSMVIPMAEVFVLKQIVEVAA
jgi:hypothetical protein